MYDFNGLRIPFKSEFLTTTFRDERVVSYVDIQEAARRGLNVVPREMEWHIDGSYQVHDLYHPWDSLPSSFTGIAFKMYQSSGFRDAPCVELKASPAKIAQGHNVYGSENLELGVRNIMQALASALPDFAQMLDFDNAEFFRIDATYSVSLPNRDVLASTLESLSRVSNKYLRPSRQGQYETTLYFNKVTGKDGINTGRTTSLCIYSKEHEVEHQLKDLLGKARKEKTNRYDHVIAALDDERLQYFAMNRLRFEARICSRFFDKYQLPRRVTDLLEFVRGYEEQNGEGSFCRHLWKTAMADLLDALNGQTIHIIHDQKVRKLLHAAYDTVTSTGKLRTAKANRLFSFYRRLTHEGYSEVKRTMSTTGKSTFYNSVNALKAIGFSKAQLQNAHKKESLPLCSLLTFDFDAQRPGHYVEPKMPAEHLDYAEFLASISSDTALDDGSLNIERRLGIALTNLGLSAHYVEGLKAGRSIRLNGEQKLSLAMWPDGEVDLYVHDVGTPDPGEVESYRARLAHNRALRDKAAEKQGYAYPQN
ncbi:phage/plasmid replication protein, II/X family [Shewanella algae]|uniref:phage/plasmid replication protein, II/X family n=2 Tax=Shewanella algae TaxID=38313 RepID=UPI0031F521AC